ncbi:MAG: AGE family epimerase/isomerase [Bryobacteraceae bacterium]
MTRRQFAAVSMAAGVGCRTAPESPAGIGPAWNLHALGDLYRGDLFDDFIPFLDKHVIDHERGGFLCDTDRAGRNITTNKTAWYEGRGIWVYSFLYHRIAKQPRYLEVARKSVEFILPHRPAAGQLWPGAFTRQGTPIPARAADIYGGLFIANGLAEYANASGEARYWTIAKEILTDHMGIYDSPRYEYPVTYAPAGAAVAAPRVLGHWMVLLRLATQMLETKSDPYVQSVADRCLEAILERHYNPDNGLLNEVLNHDLSRPVNGLEQFCYTGHAIETLWMVLFESLRRNDAALFQRARELFRRHVELAWDDLEGGFFRSLDHIANNTWKTDKVLWLQEEVLIGTLFLIEHTGDDWARTWFERTYSYVRDKFPLQRHGHSLWILAADRKVTYEEKATRVGNFHHPRHLMLNLLAIDRMVAAGGKPTGRFPSSPPAPVRSGAASDRG